MSQDLEGFRARFNRLSDAKIFNGWVHKSTPQGITVLGDPDLPLAIDDKFMFEIVTKQQRISFTGNLRGIGVGLYDFSIVSAPSAVPCNEPFRIVGKGVQVSLVKEDDVIETEVIDLAPDGLGLKTLAPLDRGLILRANIETPAGPISCDAEVCYCRKTRSSSESYRVGIKIALDDRVSRGRWVRTLNSNASPAAA